MSRFMKFVTIAMTTGYLMTLGACDYTAGAGMNIIPTLPNLNDILGLLGIKI